MPVVEDHVKFRKNIRKMLNNKIKNENISLNLEIGIFNFTIKESIN